MLVYSLRRIAGIVPLMLFVSVLTFFLQRISGIDPTTRLLGEDATEAQRDVVRSQLGLDRPILVQYLDWFRGAIRGDLGSSYYGGASVNTLIVNALPVTLSLTFGALVVALVVGLTAGTVAAVRSGRTTDKLISAGATVGQAIPNFWFGMLLIVVFALRLDLVPATGFVGPRTSLSRWILSIALPCIALGLSDAAAVARQMRSSMIGALQQDYIRAAMAKGASNLRLVFKHALKNAAIPVVTVVGFMSASLLGGSIVVERLFAQQGLGSLAIRAVLDYDPAVLQGIVLLSAFVIATINVLTDIVYVFLNPKVRPGQ